MSFIRHQIRDCAVHSREGQFLRYFRETGASEVLQKALILLHQLPIKPPDLAEYFSQYLENGARDLVNLSLLQAEHCYKATECEDIQKRIQYLENRIKALESQGFGKDRKSRIKSPNPENDATFLDNLPEVQVFEDLEEDERDDQEEQPDHEKHYSILDRFLGDLENRQQGSSMSTIISEQSAADLRHQLNVDKDNNDQNPAADDDGDGASSYANWQNEIKKLDPWGFVCSFYTMRDILRPSQSAEDLRLMSNNQPGTKRREPKISALTTIDQEPSAEQELEMLSVISSSSIDELEEKYQNYDSEDQETLAEEYHSYAYNANVQGTGNLERHGRFVLVKDRTKDEDEKVLSVFGKATKTTPSEDWSPFIVGSNNEDECDFYKDIIWQDGPKKLFSDTTDESFLLTEGNIKFDKNNADPGFNFKFHKEFQQFGRKSKEEVCGNCKKWKMTSSAAFIRDVGTMTSLTTGEGDETCVCEDCDCVWTQEDLDKVDNVKILTGNPSRFKASAEQNDPSIEEYDQVQGGSRVSQFLQEFELEASALQTGPSCPCGDQSLSPPPSPIFSECDGFCEKTVGKDEETSSFVRRASLDPELEKVFLESGGYVNMEKGRRSFEEGWGPKRSFDGTLIAGTADVDEEPKFVSEVYETLDLGEQIRKSFGIVDDENNKKLKSSNLPKIVTP